MDALTTSHKAKRMIYAFWMQVLLNFLWEKVRIPGFFFMGSGENKKNPISDYIFLLLPYASYKKIFVHRKVTNTIQISKIF